LNKTQIFTIKEMKVTIHELYFHEWNSKSFWNRCADGFHFL
jgi:hypothetical protein